jgi:hypothetical protein
MTKQKNRGKEASDDLIFGNPVEQAKIKEAVADLSYLLTKGYPEKSTLELVGNRYRLTARQQRAVMGMSASDQQVEFRKSHQINSNQLKGKEIVIDGFNVLIILESLLSEAYIFKGKDGFYRDLSSVYGTYKKVQQTSTAIDLIKDFYLEKEILKIHWIFDKPVSNSGRLKKIIEEIAVTHQLNWTVELDNNPDKKIGESIAVACTSDAWILDRVGMNFNLVEYVMKKHNLSVSVINF